jgi:hypothetical protein
MSRYLIVAHQTAGSPTLVERVRAVSRNDPGAEFVLLVPATPVRHLLRRRQREGEAEGAARISAEEAKAVFAEAGINLIDARVGDASPVDAIGEEVKGRAGYAGVIISTLPPQQSRWLRDDVPGQVERQFGLPVIHVEATPDQPEGLTGPMP